MRSFKTDNSEAPVVATTTLTPPPQTSTAVASPRNDAWVDGEVTREDIKTPWLSCVQAVGPKSVIYTPGQLVLGESAIASAPGPGQPTTKLRVIFGRVSKAFVENLPYNPQPGGPRPRTFTRTIDVTNAGGVLQWSGNTAPTFIPRTTCLALVRCPDAFEDSMFNLIDGEKTYAPALTSFQKTSYSAAKTLLTDLSLSLKGDPTATFYDLFWVRELKGQNYVWVAKLVRVRDEQPSESLRALVKKVAGGGLSFDETGDTAE